MGHLKVLSTGLKLNGNAFIMDRLIASHIKSRHSQAIILRSNSTYTFSVRNQSGSIENLITLSKHLPCVTAALTHSHTQTHHQISIENF